MDENGCVGPKIGSTQGAPWLQSRIVLSSLIVGSRQSLWPAPGQPVVLLTVTPAALSVTHAPPLRAARNTVKAVPSGLFAGRAAGQGAPESPENPGRFMSCPISSWQACF